MNPHQQTRQQLWINIATAVARSEECRHQASPAEWADKTLAAFDKTFPEQPEPQPPAPTNQYAGAFLCRECRRPMTKDPAPSKGTIRWICPCGNTATRLTTPDEQ
jgi:hypothetical protein